MTPQTPASHLAYDELATTPEMVADCRALGANLKLERAARAAVGGPHLSLRFEDYPTEIHKREIKVTEAASRLANALHLHLD